MFKNKYIYKFIFLLFVFSFVFSNKLLTSDVLEEAASSTITLNTQVKIVSDWDTGYQVAVTLTNPSNTDTINWNGQFNLESSTETVSSFWDVNFAINGTLIQFTNADWNGVISAGGSITFGFVVYNAQAGNRSLKNLFAIGTNSSFPVLAAPVLNAINVNPSTPRNYTVSWSAVANATSYTLQQSTTSNFSNPTTVMQSNVLSYSFTNQSNGTYYYRVLASNTGGNSPFSNVQAVTVNVQTPVPAAPVLNSITVNPSIPRNYVVAWNAVANATSYTLQQSTTSNFSNPTTVTQSNVLFYVFTNQSNGTYYYRVSASNASGSSSFSNVQSVTINSPTPVPVPAAPVLNAITVNPSTPRNYTVSWNAVANATSYTLQQSTTSNFSSPTTITQSNVLSYTFANQPNGTYYYRVSASNSGGSSSYSNVQNVVINVPTPVPSTGLSTFGNQIINSSGQSVRIKGVNWFGFETTEYVPHGLWARNYKDMMNQMKTLGFNAIRLPFSDQMLAGGKPGSVNYSLNSDLQGLSSIQIMDKIIQYADSIGLYIVLDHHRSAAGNGPNDNGLWYTSAYPQSTFLNNWKTLVTRYLNNPSVIAADLHNEPHESVTWGNGSTTTDWALAATNVGNAILAINPKLLIVVEGIEVYQDNYYWWGGNLMGVASSPVRLNLNNKVVYSPHDYPNSVYAQPWFSASNFPNNMPGIFTKFWAFIYQQNIAPIMIGEFGSGFTDPKDIQWMQKLVPTLNNNITPNPKGMSWLYWSWNPDSGDTGGILLDDWKTPDQNKLKYLAPLLQ